MRLAVLAFVTGLLALSGIEATLAWRDGRALSRRARSPAPYYQVRVVSTDGARLSLSDGPLQLVADPVLVYRNLPNQEGPCFRINSRGYRGPELEVPASAATRVVVLGGSTAFGTGVSSDEDTFPAQLQMEMPGSEVLNLAVIGHTSLQELQMLGTEAFLLEPRIVCDVFFELQDNSRRGFEVSNSAVSALGAMVDRLFPRLRELVMRTLRPEEQDLEVSPQEIERRAGAYAKNAITMDRLARALGFRFLVVLQPLSPARPKARARYRRFVELASQELRAGGVEAVELSSIVALTAEHFLDSMHLTAEGNRLAASAVSGHLRSVR